MGRDASGGAGHRWGIFWIFVGSMAIFAFHIGGRVYDCRDVARYAVNVLEMRRLGSMIPTIFGLPCHDAAPLAAWLPLLSVEILDALTPATIRLHSALAALATIAVTVALARRASYRIAVIAGAAAGLNSLAIALGRSSRIDAVLAFAVTLAIASFYAAGRCAGKRRIATYVLAGIAAGLGVAAKGPFAVAIIGATLVPYLLWERRWRDLLVGGTVAGLVAGIVTAAWLVPYTRLLGPEGTDLFLHEMLGRETVRKFHGQLGKVEPWYYYPIEILPKLLPWTLLALPALLRVVSRPRAASSLERLCLSWILFPVLVLSFAGGKHIRYVIPLVPAIAILAGFEFDRWLASERPRVRAGLRAVARGLGIVGSLAGILALAVYGAFFGFSVWAVVSGAGVVIAGAAGAMLARRDRVAGAFLGVYLALASGVAFVFGAVDTLPVHAEGASEYYRLAERLRPWVGPDDRLASIRPEGKRSGTLNASHLSLYLDNRPVTEYPVDSLPEEALILTRRRIEGRPVRAEIDWPRGGDWEVEIWWLHEGVGEAR